MIAIRPRSKPSAKDRATAGYGELEAARAAASRVLSEGLLDALRESPFSTTLVVVAAPTRLSLCDPASLANSLLRLHALLKSSPCEGLVATMGGGPQGRFTLPLTVFAIGGHAFLRTWRHSFNEAAAAGIVSLQHSLREAIFQHSGRLKLSNLVFQPALVKEEVKEEDGARQRSALPEESGGCFACGGVDRPVEALSSGSAHHCRPTLCSRGCAVAFNCSDEIREVRWTNAHDVPLMPPRAGAPLANVVSAEERAVAWGLLQGETCALRSLLTPIHSTAHLHPSFLPPVIQENDRRLRSVGVNGTTVVVNARRQLLRAGDGREIQPPPRPSPSTMELARWQHARDAQAARVMWHSHVPDVKRWGAAIKPTVLELASRAARLYQDAELGDQSPASSEEIDARWARACPSAVAPDGPVRGFDEEQTEVGLIQRRRRFLVATLASPDESSMLARKEPFLEFAAAKQAYASKQGYSSELLLPSRLALAAVAGDPHAVIGPAAAPGATRCELFKPLLVLDALYRYGARSRGSEAVDYILMTDHTSFISPLWFNASLDLFVEAAELSGRDFVFPATSSLDSGVFFVRNTRAARLALLEWWAATSAGVGVGCLPLDGAALELLLLRRVDRWHRNQRELGEAGMLEDDRFHSAKHRTPGGQLLRGSKVRLGLAKAIDPGLGTTAATSPWGSGFPEPATDDDEVTSKARRRHQDFRRAQMLESPLLMAPFGFSCRRPGCSAGSRGRFASCEPSFRLALNESGEATVATEGSSRRSETLLGEAPLPFIKVVNRPPPPPSSPAARRNGVSFSTVLKESTTSSTYFGLTGQEASRAAAAGDTAEQHAEAFRKTQIDGGLMGWNQDAPRLMGSPSISSIDAGSGRYEHSLAATSASSRAGSQASRDAAAAKVARLRGSMFLVEARLAGRTVATSLFPDFFEGRFARLVGLPQGTPLSLGRPAPSRGASANGKGRERRKLLLTGKEPWLRDWTARSVEAEDGSFAAAQPQGASGEAVSAVSTKSTPDRRLLKLLSYLNVAPADEWPLPRCCHPRREDRRHVCR